MWFRINPQVEVYISAKLTDPATCKNAYFLYPKLIAFHSFSKSGSCKTNSWNGNILSVHACWESDCNSWNKVDYFKTCKYLHTSFFFIFSFSNVLDTSFFTVFYLLCVLPIFFLRVLNLLVMSQGNTNNRNFHFYSNELMYSIFFIVNIPAHNSKLCIQVSKQNFFVLRCQELVHIKLCKYNLALHKLCI